MLVASSVVKEHPALVERADTMSGIRQGQIPPRPTLIHFARVVYCGNYARRWFHYQHVRLSDQSGVTLIALPAVCTPALKIKK